MKRKKKKNLYKILILLLLGIGVGYAALTTGLSINGTANIQNASWDIHFDNIIVNQNSNVTVNQAASIDTATSVSYEVTLHQPGDYYEFNVDVVNNGTIDGMVSTVSSKMNNVEITTLPTYLDYSVTYIDGVAIAPNHLLPANSTETYKVRIAFKSDLNPEDLPGSDTTLSLVFTVTYVQADENGIDKPLTLHRLIAKDAVMDNIASTYVTSNTGIDFSAISSDTNGKGVYIKNGTENSTYPIYYYRGSVNDNNVLFANFCWKIVRTTETGGIKLVYNGLPSGTNHNQCTNTTGTDTQFPSKSTFNEKHNSLADAGYIIGIRYESEGSSGNGWYYAPDVEYVNSSYTLKSKTINGTTYNVVKKSVPNGVTVGNLDYQHYTCGNTTDTTCSSVKYVHSVSTNSSYVTYITLSNGKKVEDALREMYTNTTDSTIKTVIDNWYQTNMTSYTSKLEDTIWCNDRSSDDLANHGWDPDGGSTSNTYVYYNPYNRVHQTHQPSLICNNKNDSYTVTETSNGNGDLTYPIGLLTADEVMLAGGTDATNNSTYYLYSGTNYWLISPKWGPNNTQFCLVSDSGYLYYAIPESTIGVRPSISLKSNTSIAGGDGTSTNPYVVQ